MATLLTGRKEAGGATTVIAACTVRTAHARDTFCSRLAREFASFAEHLHRSMAIQVSAAKFTIGDVTVLAVWSGDADSSYVPAIATAQQALRKAQAVEQFNSVMEGK